VPLGVVAGQSSDSIAVRADGIVAPISALAEWLCGPEMADFVVANDASFAIGGEDPPEFSVIARRQPVLPSRYNGARAEAEERGNPIGAHGKICWGRGKPLQWARCCEQEQVNPGRRVDRGWHLPER